MILLRHIKKKEVFNSSKFPAESKRVPEKAELHAALLKLTWPVHRRGRKKKVNIAKRKTVGNLA